MFNSIEDYVNDRDGTSIIEKILIANNGISAVKCIRSVRKWSYDTFGDEKKITFIVMATPEDLGANMEYIRMADQVVEVPGGPNYNNYANVSLIVELAERYNVDAVWAGWGHASENPHLPDTLEQTFKHDMPDASSFTGKAKKEKNVIFIGPPGRPMRALGDKIGSTLIAQSAHVPTIGWNGDGMKVDYRAQGHIPDQTYEDASIKDGKHCLHECKRIGFPVMIKASEGGGGKGIRKVMEESEVESAFRAVQGEIPGSPIFVMKLAPKSRHLEVQLLADKYNNAISLSGRDCSVQRRHQKIIEEGPVLAPTPEVWTEMQKAACRLAKEVDYVNAGTVEYLFTEKPDPSGNQFFFLELNPRLQVEHPVTEMITGVNLPACQVQVAMGIPLQMIPDVRKFYQNEPLEKSPIDLDNDPQIPPLGHVIATRITAEDANNGFRPTSGNITELNFRSTPDVWGYFSVDSSGSIHEFADSQFGHLFSFSDSREKARKNMVIALKELTIRGDIHTTIEYIAQMMESPDFKENRISTSWLDERIKRHSEVSKQGRPDSLMVVLVGAVCCAFQSSSKKAEEYINQLERGQVPPPELLSQLEKHELIYEGIKYNIEALRSGPSTFTLRCNGSHVQVEIRTLSDGGYLVLLNGKSHVAYATKESQGLRLIVDGNTCVFTNEYDPTKLVVNAAGKLARYLVDDGAKVRKGMPYAEVEVMKMYMPLLTPEDGIVHFVKQEGSVLAPGDLIATMELDDPSCVKKSEVFEGKLPKYLSTESSSTEKTLHVLKSSLSLLYTVLDGYIVPDDVITSSLNNVIEAFKDPVLPVDAIKDTLSSLASRMPPQVHDKIVELLDNYKNSVFSARKENSSASVPEFNMQEVVDVLDSYKNSLGDDKEASTFETNMISLRDMADQYLGGLKQYRESVLTDLISRYNSVESLFARRHNLEDIILNLRRENSDDLKKAFDIARSHQSVGTKNKLLLQILPYVRQIHLENVSNGLSKDSHKYVHLLEDLANFKEKEYSLVALEARHILMDLKMPSFNQRLSEIESTVREIVSEEPPYEKNPKFEALLDETLPIFDLLMQLLNSSDIQVRQCALEIYVRRVYRSYNIVNMETTESDGLFVKNFQFKAPNTDAVSVSLTPAESYDDLASLASKTQKDGNTSDSDASNPSEAVPSNVTRRGAIAMFPTMTALKKGFEQVVKNMNAGVSIGSSQKEDPVNVLHMLLYNESIQEKETLEEISAYVKENKSLLEEQGVRRISFAVKSQLNKESKSDDAIQYPGIYTFRQRLGFDEDMIVRHVEAPLAYTLELKRLRNYHVAPVKCEDKNVHLYLARPRSSALLASNTPKTDNSQRFFVRAVVRQLEKIDEETIGSRFDAHPGPERNFVDALNALELAMGQASKKDKSLVFKNNHLFLNIIPVAVVDPQYIEAVIRILAIRYVERLAELKVSEVELKISAKFNENGPSIPVRLVATNPTGYVLRVESYVETKTHGSDEPVFTSVGDDTRGKLDGQSVSTPYPVSFGLNKKRELAQRMTNTLYIYDYLELIEHSIMRQWNKLAKTKAANGIKLSVPSKFLETTELVLDDNDTKLKHVTREKGLNDIGMVAWLLKMYTPEYPNGREVIVIGNDISFKAGSFGTREDRLFELASVYARKLGVPRLFFSANSGARIGMAESVKAKYRVAWKNESDPLKGFEYLYLTPEDYHELASAGAVNAEAKEVNGETRYILKDVIGEESDLGVENLRGSGTIAGETSRAYKDVFTLTYACGRSVGIGAYLVRLGQRTIQNVAHSPIILTGYMALNKLMGRDVYTSNDQLGGINIMYPNGVTHLEAANHMQGINSMLEWLSFVPAVRHGMQPIRDISGIDTVERAITYYPGKTSYDPRELIVGKTEEASGKWLSGFMDKDSFVESLAGWAKAVVVGRARLGGIPCGVVLTENRTTEKVIPADPASPATQESIIQQAGQVWFPDSANKTATAIRDFKGEDLPLFIFANWRGFSGGQRDMFEEVLKFGATIVDALVDYEQPVFVYIPPNAEIRGGAWVVVDPTINAGVMEMYSDKNGRGGVLEPAGLIAIKYRQKQLISTAHRLDKTLQELDQELESLDSPNDPAAATLKEKIQAREKQLLPLFTQIATQFADLHDTPGRMKAKEVIRDVVEWESARSYFYWRLKRRLAEFQVRHSITASCQDVKFSETEEILKSWYLEAVKSGKARSSNSEDAWNVDEDVLSWLSSYKEGINEKIQSFTQERVANEIIKLGLQNPKAAVAGILDLVKQLDAKDREEAVAALRRGSIFEQFLN